MEQLSALKSTRCTASELCYFTFNANEAFISFHRMASDALIIFLPELATSVWLKSVLVGATAAVEQLHNVHRLHLQCCFEAAQSWLGGELNHALELNLGNLDSVTHCE